MEISDEELFRRLREAESTSKARAKPSPPRTHPADTLGFALLDMAVGAAREWFYRLVFAGFVLLALAILVLQR